MNASENDLDEHRMIKALKMPLIVLEDARGDAGIYELGRSTMEATRGRRRQEARGDRRAGAVVRGRGGGLAQRVGRSREKEKEEKKKKRESGLG